VNTAVVEHDAKTGYKSRHYIESMSEGGKQKKQGKFQLVQAKSLYTRAITLAFKPRDHEVAIVRVKFQLRYDGRSTGS